jgi:hypothetical protein
MKCPYCGNDAELTTGYTVYPHRLDLAHLKLWACLPCDAWVGTHKNSPTNAPLGRMANAELRRAKMAAHAAFDPIWKSGSMPRSKAYALLASLMKLPKSETHIGMFDVQQCKQVVEVCKTMAPAHKREPFMVYS